MINPSHTFLLAIRQLAAVTSSYIQGQRRLLYQESLSSLRTISHYLPLSQWKKTVMHLQINLPRHFRQLFVVPDLPLLNKESMIQLPIPQGILTCLIGFKEHPTSYLITSTQISNPEHLMWVILFQIESTPNLQI